ncbi:hypothetical protein HLB44_03825 [Aquincola sp. S2]|uniref:DUF8198 domain-containing protein n=1 Tax=Pseudaquabacterium terrae TaxID=2732868 RepID=A0ABX2EBG4_9BURK|nr:hypothetical protein [Aquabacterium terrae]NRF66112.1 hypothetical protein [Aquabacterium terrae]
MSPAGQQILDHLARVERLRLARADDPAQTERVQAVKAYQARRFERGYADLLADARYCRAARFFLDELYGPQEFAARDAQFARIVPALVRMFPDEIVRTVAALARLHALSEDLDDTMARQLDAPAIDAAVYRALWQRTGRAQDRQAQIDLTIQIGEALDHYTRSHFLRGALRMMRQPARAAGLGELQRFLEVGFETFGSMKGAQTFLGTVRQREEALANALFDGGAITSATTSSGTAPMDPFAALGQLP